MMIRFSRTVLLLPVVLFFLASTIPGPRALAKGPSQPKPAPAFKLPTRSGTPVVLDSLRGKVVLVDFWASWCEPCKKSFPWLSSMHKQYFGKGLTIVAINLDKNTDEAVEFLDKFPAPFVVAYDASGKTAEAFDVSVMPTSFLIDKQGRIILTHPGFDLTKTGPLEDAIKEACAP